MNDLEARIREVLHEDANRAPFVGAMPEQVRPRVRRRQATTVLTASMAAVALIAGSVFVVRSFDRSAVTPAPPVPVSPTPDTHWSLEVPRGASPVHATQRWEDPRDTAEPWVDIVSVKYSLTNSGHWEIDLAETPTRGRGPTQVLSYGLVLDTKGDGVADYLVGIEDRQTGPGDYRVWVTDLATGETSEQIGPPYGYPIEFAHPDESAGRTRPWSFTFLGEPEGSMPARCASTRGRR